MTVRPPNHLAQVFLALAVTYGIYQCGRAFFHPKQGLDFTPEYVASRMLFDEGDLRFYDYEVVKEYGRKFGLHGPLGETDPVVNYAYPPWLAVAYAPLSRLPWEAARRIWFIIGLAATCGAAMLLGAAVAPTRQKRREFVLIGLAAACLFFPVPYGLMTGQANDLPLLGIAASLFLLRSGRPFAAGLVLAPAGLWKIFTGFPALFLIARREWRALWGLVAGCVTIVLLSLPFVGPAAWLDWARYIPRQEGLPSPGLRNHSIAAAVHYLLQPNEVLVDGRTLAIPPLFDAPGLAGTATVVLSILAVAATALALLRPARRDDPLYAVQFAATLVLAVLLTPKSWEHYGVFLLPAFLACVAAEVGSATARPRTLRLAALGTAFAVWGLLYQTKDDYLALATWPRVAFIPAKAYASAVLLGLCVMASAKRVPRAGEGAGEAGAAASDDGQSPGAGSDSGGTQ
jgi:hypothetical protein